ncbi:TRAP transporter substrate-binding protein [Humitalea sp. 24SJ18S-53]|uniref:TRAP transporter substrate-binding protein n=1 Tax=Humitalea sp. 24SJ18S-53 TaxID=3422307 RepID=UPI003D66D65F
MEHPQRRTLLRGLAAGTALLAAPHVARAQAVITLNGASQFNDEHVFTRALVRFEELVKQYYGQPINFVMHKNSSLGLEKQYFEYMSAGRAVDYGIVSPAHMSTFSRAAPFIDAPFLFRDLAHWNAVLDADMFAPIADEVDRRARVKLIGWAGGGIRNIFSSRPATNMAEIRNLRVRVQGAPIWSRTFQAIGMAPQVIAYNEVYNAIQNNVIEAGENEAAGVEQMRFFEVGPNLLMTRHAITIRPICFSTQTFNRLPPALQAAVVRAGKEAGVFGRQAESTEDEQKITALAAAGRLRKIEFTERPAMQAVVEPVMAAYAREIDAGPIFARINAQTS